MSDLTADVDKMANFPDKLIPTKSPSLPLGPVEYSRQYQDQLNNILRLYFTSIDNLNQGLLGNVGGRFLGSPHGSFYDTETQSDGADTPNPVQLNGTFTGETIGFTVANNDSGNPTRVTAEYPGIYNFQFSLQLQNTDNAQQEVTIWARINGVDVANSATDITVPARKSSSIYGYAVAAWNFVLPLQANDYFELMWASSSALVTIPYKAAQTSPYVRPAIPSTILTVSFVSAIPA